MTQSSKQTFHYGFIASGFLTLLGASYLDSIRGPLLPVIAQDLNIDYGDIGWFLTVGSLAALAFVGILLVSINATSERRLTLLSLSLAIFSCLAVIPVTGFWSLLAFGFALGGSISLMGTICNVLTIRGTPIESRPKVLAGSHVMYGLGCIISPVIVAVATRKGIPWQYLLACMSIFFLALGYFVYRCLPSHHETIGQEPERLRLNGRQIFVVSIFMSYVAGEVLISMWMSAFLTEAYNFDIKDTTLPLSLFFGCMAISRVFCFFFLKPHMEKFIILASVVASFAAFMTGYLYWPLALGFCGFIGPFYPILLGYVSRVYPFQWRAIAIWINIAIQLGLAIFHLLVGKLASIFGLSYSYLTAPILLVTTLVMTAYLLKTEVSR